MIHNVVCLERSDKNVNNHFSSEEHSSQALNGHDAEELKARNTECVGDP